MIGLSVLVCFGASCSSKDPGADSANESSEAAASAKFACDRLVQYADVGIPATYISDAVDLLAVVADSFDAAGLPDAATAVINEAIPAVQGDFVTALQFKPILRRIHSTWCN